MYSAEKLNIEEIDVNNIKDIYEMNKIKNEINTMISNYYANIEQLKKKIILIDNNLMKNCNHIWKRDYSYCGEHSEYKCSICNLNK